MNKVKKLLCFLRVHNYKFCGIDLIPTGAYLECKWCGKKAYQSWL